MARSSGGLVRPEAINQARVPRARLVTRGWTNYLYLVPILLFVGLIYYTIIYTLSVSSLDWDGISPEKHFVGLENYTAILRDPVFYEAIRHTFTFMVLAVFIQMALGLAIALLLNARVRLTAVYKVIFFLPVVLAPAVISYVFRHIYDANGGNLNAFLQAIGLGGVTHAWLADPSTALYALTAINIWEWTGFSFLMYYAALTQIDEHLYEAARIDGADLVQLLRYITIPLLRTTHYSLIILGVIGALKTFDIVYLTTGGGPGHATEFLSTYIYRKAILEYHAGYSAALSVFVLVMALVLTIIQLRAYHKQ